MFPPDRAWNPTLDWNAPAGAVLKKFIAHLPKDRVFKITVFVSSPIQLGIDSDFVSGDVDIFSEDDFKEIIQKAGFIKGETQGAYIEKTEARVFRAGVSWHQRAFVCQIDNAILTFPHPVDILVAKILRLADKDLRAFRLVYEKTGHPTPAELKKALQEVVDIYRPPFDEEDPCIGNALINTQTVWRELYNQDINVRAEIIMPALAMLRKVYGLDLPDLKKNLNDIANG
jgi:hypothetical protein